MYNVCMYNINIFEYLVGHYMGKEQTKIGEKWSSHIWQVSQALRWDVSHLRCWRSVDRCLSLCVSIMCRLLFARVPIEMHCVHADDKACMNAGVFALTSMCASLPDTISPPLIVWHASCHSYREAGVDRLRHLLLLAWWRMVMRGGSCSSRGASLGEDTHTVRVVTPCNTVTHTLQAIYHWQMAILLQWLGLAEK